MKLLKFLMTIFFLSTVTLIKGEDNKKYTSYIPEIVSKSPNTASLGIYGEIPVGYYTGTPEISIPLYELNLNGLKVPINLSYHASGIKVAQESSWVGLGWSLSAGGCITRDIKGFDDFGKGAINGYNWSGKYIPYKKENNNRYFFLDPNGNNDDYNRYFNFFQMGSMDSEPDVFYFNFCGFSGSMSFKRNTSGSVKDFLVPTVRAPKDYMDLKYYIADEKWVIKDNKGFTYYFGSKEHSHPYNLQATECKSHEDDDLLNFYSLLNSGDEYVSAWYLDSISSPQHLTIKFKYESDKIYTVTQQSEVACITPHKDAHYTEHGYNEYYYSSFYISPGDDNYHLSNTLNISAIEQLRLSEIDAPDCSIAFYASKRKDLRRYSTDLVSPNQRKIDPVKGKLDRMDISSFGNPIKSINFAYSYYGDTLDHKKCRLRLDSIYEGSATSFVNKYKFQYNKSIILPAKNSNAIDYWGYYNGKNFYTGCWRGVLKTNSTLPAVSVGNVLENNVKEYQYDGADRHADSKYMSAGILISIQYPTGGRTCFEYEPHKFEYNHSSDTIGGGLRIKKIYNIVNNKEQNVKIYKYGSGTLMNLFLDYYSLTRVRDNSQVPITHISIDTPPPYNDLSYLNVAYPTQGPDGILQMSSSVIPTTTNSAGAVVGYSHVEELLGEGNDYRGKTVHEFHNRRNHLYDDTTDSEDGIDFFENYFIPGFPSVPDLQNGEPTVTGIYDSNNKLKQEISYGYEKDPSVCDSIDGFQAYVPPVCGNCVYVRYYFLKSEWWKLVSKTVSNYSNASVQTYKESYTYDPKSKLIRSTTRVYHDKIYRTDYTYPFDYSPLIYKNMTAKNMINYPLEQTEFCNNKLYNSILHTYREENNMNLLDCIYSFSSGFGTESFTPYNGNSFDLHYGFPQVEFSKYDIEGNILQYKIRGEKAVSFIWSYQKLFPVAKVENISYDELATKIGADYLENLSNQSAPDVVDLYNKLSKSMMSTMPFSVYSYIPSIGIAQIIDQRGVSTYYNYDSFRRLVNIKDNHGFFEKIIKYHTYGER